MGYYKKLYTAMQETEINPKSKWAVYSVLAVRQKQEPVTVPAPELKITKSTLFIRPNEYGGQDRHFEPEMTNEKARTFAVQFGATEAYHLVDCGPERQRTRIC